MSDEDLAAALKIPVAVVATLGNAHRAAYERLVEAGDAIDLWQAGLGPKPEGVIVCHEHKLGRRRKARKPKDILS